MILSGSQTAIEKLTTGDCYTQELGQHPLLVYYLPRPHNLTDMSRSLIVATSLATQDFLFHCQRKSKQG